MSFHLHPGPAPVTTGQPSSYNSRVANHAEIAASLWGHFHTDLSTIYPSTPSAPIHLPSHSYERSTISHLPANGLSDSFGSLDFPSNVPSLWGYQTLLGFTPGSLSQLNPYSGSTYVQVASSSPSQATTPYAEVDQSYDERFPPTSTLASAIHPETSTPSQPIPYYHVPSPSLLNQNIGYPAFDQSNRNSPAFKMFKCTLDPSCEMEFTRAEHLARHERQHKVSVHKEDAQQNTLTEERLVQVHKNMQRQNNIRKAATMAAQRQDRLERCPSMTESSESTYSPAPSSFSGSSLRRPSSTGYRYQSQPSPIPTKTPDKALWTQFGTPPFRTHQGLVPNSSAPLEINGNANVHQLISPDLRTDYGTPLETVQRDANADSSDEFHRLSAQCPPRLINYNQISRAPLSSLWSTSQQSSSIPSNFAHSSSSDEGAKAPNEIIAQKVTRPTDHGAGLLFKMNDGVLSHHLQFLSTLTHEQSAIVTPRKFTGSPTGHGGQGFVENQRAYSGYLVVGQNTPEFGASPSRKRALATDDGLELGSIGHENEQTSAKKMRI
ncbi:hypothetical protein PGT21_002085 [Puccinia graminis f. sp. tritici]|uniref:C2H2-type domain-containing protein n=1 Tax=Puccinia graminis f. sp. tritici TaxID=56615 RepID=A0A5B0M504_PUCGR|nr:hypothetical protein PGT21_002085 [Puccinia graminis f. sp. tritici]